MELELAERSSGGHQRADEVLAASDVAREVAA
jgi:hypothetical protein